MTTHSHPFDDASLDTALSLLREAAPAEPMRREEVWSHIEASRGSGAGAERRSPRLRRWQLAAAAVLVVAGASLAQHERARRAGRPRGTEPSARILADAGRVLAQVSSVAPGSATADSLRDRSAMLLASTRTIVDRPDAARSPATLAVLHDVEYALAQVVQGGLSDPIERELTVESIRIHRIAERATKGGL